MTEKKSTLLVCWFKKEQWDHLLEIISDPDNLGKTYAEWRKGAEHNISMFRNTGGKVVKMHADTEQMLQWSKENNVELSSENLSQYAFHLYEDKYPSMVVCWYKKDQWDHLQEIVSDSKALGKTYEEWAEEAEKDIDMFRSKGQRVKKITVDTEQMLQWANDNKIKLESANLANYAMHLFEKDHKQEINKLKRKQEKINKLNRKKRANNKYGNNFY